MTGCSASKKFTNENEGSDIRIITADSNKEGSDISTDYDLLEGNVIRVLLDEYSSEKNFTVINTVNLSSSNKKSAVIKSNNRITLKSDKDGIQLSVQGKSFYGKEFELTSEESDGIINIDGKRYRGKLRILNINSKVSLINQISLEDYVKGVMTKEMPLGKGTENYEALKAFSICARTYALTKIFNSRSHYDILPDTRDQVYGGVEGESEYSNRIVDETRGKILFYDNVPATIFYHSTCGGSTEKAVNVFTKDDIPYLQAVKDGSPANCSISPRFEWTEIIPEYKIIDNLIKAGYLNNTNFSIKRVNINSRFENGRVNELEFVLTDNDYEERKVQLYGNKIRSVIRTSDQRSILRSNYFDINLSNNTIVIKGKGNGHGVGLCQWGAIGLSRKGIDFRKIIEHYFPGTQIKRINDK